MELKIEDVLELNDKLEDSDSIIILPDNIFRTDKSEEYFYSSTLPTIRKIISSKGIPLDRKSVV